jgi:hypothetical protein
MISRRRFVRRIAAAGHEIGGKAGRDPADPVGTKHARRAAVVGLASTRRLALKSYGGVNGGMASSGSR